jgi:surface carbohydrate biosynthesis protein
LIDSAAIVVFIDSTLGYEAIARGKKVAGFSCRFSETPSLHRQFGWPCDLPETGPCWTNSRDEKEFERIMNYLNQVTDTAFQTDCAIFLKKLMIFDQDNTRFVSLLKRIMQAGTHTRC